MAYSRIRKLGAYLRPHRQRVALGVGALFVVNALSVYIPLAIGNAIDEGLTSSGSLWFYVASIAVLASVMWIVRMLSRVWLFGIGREVEFDLKQRIFQHLLRLEPSYFATNSVGDLINRATSDVDNIRRLLGFAILSTANTIFAYALTLPVMLAIDLRLSVLALAPYPLILITVQLFSDRLREEQRQVQERLSDVSEAIQEDMSGIALVKIYSQEDNQRRAFGRLNRQLLDANLKLARSRNLLFPLIEGLASASLLVLVWQGSQALASGVITNGNFLELIVFAQRLVFPIALLGFTITAYQRGEVSVDRVEAILNAEPQIQSEPDATVLPLENVRGRIEARDLTYTFPGARAPALDCVGFAIEPGETVAVVGTIGAGKSTLANALPRLLDIAPGQLFLDGIDITEIALNDLRQAIAYVPQDSFLFSTSVGNNIAYVNPLSDLSEVEGAAKQSQIHNEIVTFPRQYDTIVGERGITLSGGQRQRTSLARALIARAPVLILDDALSSVDNQTATRILAELANGVQQRTILFVTHQLSAAAKTDRILVMDSGRVVDSGTHDELLARPGLYRSLWQQHQLESVLS
ncbi:ABC-type multidrug transport system, ATPase and permease component [Rubidibacter lacunae KORDI 51-2]|uniref:ABC-type multidrug transport system, ATPase and permease component n=1 Tax=Rubidibacter lacunae KORDI 51-2 TaxID=582515 RepID=U5DI23_9CHRO|nr:ABC transporter ATP-binding protein [Rubidibacter lacunae]ERN40254.1 ABC-type multidrug transport system, ATPase and permease component [Rubidibacter lacunae KORDI 51-2]